MRTLYLLRHAKSAADPGAGDDHERALSPRGKRAARIIARHFRRLGADPDLVLCSSAARARETLDLVLPGFPRTPLIAIERGLYLASAAAILARLAEVEESVARVLVIGHNPGLQEFALDLAAASPAAKRTSLAAKFPTGALATYAVEAPWAALAAATAQLTAYVVPAELVD
jgi:phosphohistidine phosphatase